MGNGSAETPAAAGPLLSEREETWWVPSFWQSGSNCGSFERLDFASSRYTVAYRVAAGMYQCLPKGPNHPLLVPLKEK
jgi:hypothetical protein